jgi:hypothetical protein
MRFVVSRVSWPYPPSIRRIVDARNSGQKGGGNRGTLPGDEVAQIADEMEARLQGPRIASWLAPERVETRGE